MPRHAIELPSPLDRRPFRHSDGLAAGLTTARMRRTDMARPFHGVRVATAHDHGDLSSRCRALAAVMDDRHAFAHVTALRLWGVDVPERLDRLDDLYVVVRRPADRIRRPGVRSFTRGGEVRTMPVRGLRVAEPAAAFLHVAADLDVEDLVVLGDALTRRGHPLTDLVRLTGVLDESARRRGTQRARSALGLVVPGTDSVPETRTRLLLERHGFPRPQINQVVRDEAGAYLARPDLSYPELRIAIEYDGDYHRTDRRAWRVDVERRQRLEDAGWRILTVTADTLRAPGPFLARLATLLRP